MQREGNSITNIFPGLIYFSNPLIGAIVVHLFITSLFRSLSLPLNDLVCALIYTSKVLEECTVVALTQTILADPDKVTSCSGTRFSPSRQLERYPSECL